MRNALGRFTVCTFAVILLSAQGVFAADAKSSSKTISTVTATPAPTPSPTSSPEMMPGFPATPYSASLPAHNEAIFYLSQGSSSGGSGMSAMNTSFEDFMKMSLSLGNPLTAALFSPRTGDGIAATPASEAQSFSCSAAAQLVWIPAPPAGLAADKVGYCSTIQSCRGEGVPSGDGVQFPVSFGNDLTAISCDDVVVVGAGYKTYGDNIPMKNAYVWWSSMPSDDRVRFLHRSVGCESADLSQTISCPACAGGASCSSVQSRAAEALLVSPNGLNVIGEMYPGASSSNRFGSTNPQKLGFLWRGIFRYPLNNGDLQALSATPVTSTGIPDSLQLFSAFYNPEPLVPNFANTRGVALLSSMLGGGMTMAGVHSATSTNPRDVIGAKWDLPSSFSNTSTRRIDPAQLTETTELYNVKEVRAGGDGDPMPIAVGSLYDAQSDSFSAIADVLDDQSPPAPLNDDIRCPTNFPTCADTYRSTRVTAFSDDGQYFAGHMYDANSTLLATEPNLGRSVYYGFEPGLPVVWSTGARPQAIQLPDNARGGIIWDVAPIGANQAIAVGSYIPNESLLPIGFASVCTKGATSLCCTPAVPLAQYLRARGVTVPSEVEMFTATGVSIRGREIYFSGTGRGYSSDVAFPRGFSAKITLSDAGQCQAPSCS